MFVVMSSGNPGGVPIGHLRGRRASCRRTTRACSSAPGKSRSRHIENPSGHTKNDRREMLDTIGKLAQLQRDTTNDPEILEDQSRDGVSNARQCPTSRTLERAGSRSRHAGRTCGNREHLRAIACWRGAWPSATCATR